MREEPSSHLPLTSTLHPELSLNFPEPLLPALPLGPLFQKEPEQVCRACSMLPAPTSLTPWMWCELPVLLAKATPPPTIHIIPVPNQSSQTDPSSFDLLAFHSPCSRLAFSPTVPPKLSSPRLPVTSTSSKVSVHSQGCTFVVLA